MRNWKSKAIAELTADIKAAGYRVFLAAEGEGLYGFYTDQQGSRVVSFQLDYFTPRFSGNYKSKKCGTGWGLVTSDYKTMFDSNPPHWATNGENVILSTLADHMKNYAASSNFKEV